MKFNIIENIENIKFEPINQKYFSHNLLNDFHFIAINGEEENIIFKEIINWEIIKIFPLNWENNKFYKRVFNKEFSKKIMLYMIKDPKPVYENNYSIYSSKFINKKFKEISNNISYDARSFYMTSNPREFLEKFLMIFGFKSLKLLDIDNLKLIKLKPLSEPIGTLGWESFSEFISFANISCNWIVIRNFEFLPFNFFENDKDIDILCSNQDIFIDKLNLKKRSWGISAYQVKIEGKEVPVDLRFLGDGYFDKLWEYNLLENKIYQNQLVPRPNDCDYFYTLIYHCKLQKEIIKKNYYEILNNLSIKLDLEHLHKSFINDDFKSSEILANFLNINKYNISKPIDKNVKFNQKFYIKLIKYIKKISIPEPPLIIRLLILIPLPLRKILIKLKNFLKVFVKTKIFFKTY